MNNRIVIQNISGALVTVYAKSQAFKLSPGQSIEVSHLEYTSDQIRNLEQRGLISVRGVDRRFSNWNDIQYREVSGPPPLTGDFSVYYDGYADAVEAGALVQDITGAFRRVALSVDPAGARFVAYHRGAQKWIIGFTVLDAYGQPDVSAESAAGIYMTTGSAIPGVCPGPGWTRLNVPQPGARRLGFEFAARGEWVDHQWCDMPDGSVATLMTDFDSGLRHLTVIRANGTVELAGPAPAQAFSYGYFRLIVPRGINRLFLFTTYDYYSPAAGYFSDPPYSTWSSCSGLNGNGNWHSSCGHVWSRANGELVMLRPWMRYGPTSGSQDEIWGSNDGGVSWALTARPWGTYGSMSVDARGAGQPHFVGNRWVWFTYGDSQHPIFITTTDLLTFVATDFPSSANYPYYLNRDAVVADRAWGVGQNPETGNWADLPWQHVSYKVDQLTGAVTYDSAPPIDPPSPDAAPLRFSVARDDRPWNVELP